MAGGTSNHGNALATISGRAEYQGHSPAAGAGVYLRPRDFLGDTAKAMNKETASNFRFTRVDASGFYAIDSVDTGSYAIELKDTSSNAAFLECSANTGDSTINLRVATLKAPATISGTIDLMGLANNPVAYIQVRGLDYVARTDSLGAFSLPNIPEGVFDLRVTYNTQEYAPRESISVAVSTGEDKSLGVLSPLPSVDSSGMDLSILLTVNGYTEQRIRYGVKLLLVRKPDTYLWSNSNSPQSITLQSLLKQEFSSDTVNIIYSYGVMVQKLSDTQWRIVWQGVNIKELVPGIYVLAISVYNGSGEEYGVISEIQDLKRGITLGQTNPWAIHVK